jgi:hypothetical protein
MKKILVFYAKVSILATNNPQFSSRNWMRVNNHIVRLLGEKMVDEIDSLLPCLGIIFVKNFCNIGLGYDFFCIQIIQFFKFQLPLTAPWLFNSTKFFLGSILAYSIIQYWWCCTNVAISNPLCHPTFLFQHGYNFIRSLFSSLHNPLQPFSLAFTPLPSQAQH